MAPAIETDPADYVVTTIRIPRAVHAALRIMACEHANQHGGRVSISGVLAALAMERRQGELVAAA